MLNFQWLWILISEKNLTSMTPVIKFARFFELIEVSLVWKIYIQDYQIAARILLLKILQQLTRESQKVKKSKEKQNFRNWKKKKFEIFWSESYEFQISEWEKKI